MQNLFKKTSTFKCVHDVHRHFKSEMSPYHVLVAKNCYPDGCVYFQWKCRLLAKQKSCFRNFKKVGRKCFNCKYFYEEKVHQYPEPMLTESEYAEFVDDFDEFFDWIQSLQKKRVLCEGTVTSVRPDLNVEVYNNHPKIILRGYLIGFQFGFIDNIHFEDSFYLRISTLSQNKLQIRSGDNIEFEATLILDRGRLKFVRPGRFQFFERGTAEPPKKSDSLVALNSATIQNGQPEKCLGCSKGILADLNGPEAGPRRTIVCLMGMPDYQLCNYTTPQDQSLNNEICANPKWKNGHCNYTL